ncbi:hypothetical protein H5410_054042 [Solanum commersonii]|uniref:Uncharacterized protein n=1 Tax=Solanum commersonii TaxID=4109 RepID=A0A9J5X6P8_SOLCO|nr:hypothetical protein H5410_054042 [Solanum commersonii]
MIATFCDQTMKLKIYIGDFRRLLDKSFFISDCRKMSSGKPAAATSSRTAFCGSTAVSASFCLNHCKEVKTYLQVHFSFCKFCCIAVTGKFTITLQLFEQNFQFLSIFFFFCCIWNIQF